MKRNILFLLAMAFSTMLHAQMVKEITVSKEESYTDHISLKVDTRDMDMMVKFVFDEEKNTLTVSLISYRSLFVFWDQVHYSPLIKGRKLRPKMLPYVAECDANDRFKVSKVFERSIPNPRKKFTFNRWNSYEGLQPVPQDYQLVNDYISQTFDIVNKRDRVSFTLRDVFIMEHTGYTDYEIFFGKDMYTKYQITIQRDPCFGKEDEINSINEARNGVAAAYENFNEKYGSGQVSSKEALKLFKEMKDVLVSQFPLKETQSGCEDIQNAVNSYNQYVKKINAIDCVVVSSGGSGSGGGAGSAGSASGIFPKDILQKARQIDQYVARWLNSRDAVERRDLVRQCSLLVKEGNAAINSLGVRTQEQKQAVSVFREAVRYYNSICK